MELLKEQCAEQREGTSAVLLQCGLDENWWADSLELQVPSAMGKHRLKGPIIRFGATVHNHPISTKHQSRFHQIGKKVLSVIFLGYALVAGGIWKGDFKVADIDELGKVDESEIHARRLNAKEVLTFS